MNDNEDLFPTKALGVPTYLLKSLTPDELRTYRARLKKLRRRFIPFILNGRITSVRRAEVMVLVERELRARGYTE